MQPNWPTLSYPEAKDTYATLHLFTQVVGKIKLSKMPWINHSWHVTLTLTPKGLTTSSLADEEKHFEIDFDFIHHQLQIITGEGENRVFGLEGLSVADFTKKTITALDELEIKADISMIPNEIPGDLALDKDEIHKTYQPQQVQYLHKALLNTQHVFTRFRAEFTGKCSPVHFFWGGFDLAVTRFSGREAPLHPGGVPNLPDWVAQEAYSHEVSSCGFWPGNEAVPFAAFYSYIYPDAAGYKDYKIFPEEAYYDTNLYEFILPYSVVQQAENPTKTLLDFLHSTYEAAAETAHWDSKSFETKIINDKK